MTSLNDSKSVSTGNVKEIVTTGTEIVQVAANTANRTNTIDKNESILSQPPPPPPPQQQPMMNAWTTTALPTLQQPQPQQPQIDIAPQPVTLVPQPIQIPMQMPIQMPMQMPIQMPMQMPISSSNKLAAMQMFKVDTSFGKSIPNAPAVTRGGNGAAGGQLLQFPWKLHEMLRLAEQNDKSDIISWLNGGSIGGIGVGFKVHKKDRFCSEIMPGYFASQKYKTFQRSLNLWGFESVAKGEERGACYHKFFVKGRPELCHNMTRVKIKGKSNHRTPAAALAAANAAKKAATAISDANNLPQGGMILPGGGGGMPFPITTMAVNGTTTTTANQSQQLAAIAPGGVVGMNPVAMANYNTAMQNFIAMNALHQLNPAMAAAALSNPAMNAMIASQIMAASASAAASTNNTNLNNKSMPTILGEPIPIAPAVATTSTSTIPGVAPIAPLVAYNIQDQDHTMVPPPGGTVAASPQTSSCAYNIQDHDHTMVPPPGGTVAASPQTSLFQLRVGVGVGVPTTTTTAPSVITTSSFSTDRGGTTAPAITAAVPSPTKSTNEYKQVQV
eukprot:CAMPEP_0170899078 /NCGR_PEP_ID=MMETSP0734-20130129/46436_1 /TAXON_ID=186038 /ORGANISM="Fragilariopsis kerguelensis, Strain L26-C5" /LENGTH=557 /DNA_ID=CAMNT_0011291963 /DNA_START=15 /DNA_END=1689 /DNA_ORIENTATION=+